MKTLLVTTGRGMFGGALVKALADQPDVHVRAMVRNPDSFAPIADNVVAVYGDMDKPDTLTDAVAGVTDIFLVSPMDDHIATREINVIDAATRSNQDIRVLKLHGAVEHRGDNLSQLHGRSIEHMKASGLPWTMICPNSVMETSFLSLAPTIKQGFLVGTSGPGKVGFVALADVAEATADVVCAGSYVGDSVMLTGPAAIDMSEVAAAFSAALGTHVTYSDMSEDDYADLLINAGVFPDRHAVEIGVLCHYRAWRRGDAALVSTGFADVTGRAPMSVSDWAVKNIDVFR